VIRRAPLVEEDAQCFEALGHQVCPGRVPQVGHDAFELVAVSADRDPERDAATAELIERRHLLRQEHGVAHRKHQDSRGQAHDGRAGRDARPA